MWDAALNLPLGPREIFVKSELELLNNSVKVNQREPLIFIKGDLPSIPLVEGLIKTRGKQLK
ncbi:hypothetical protein NIES3806_08810 [Microcystis aeruginosa NIES-3806]|uniref:Uncharacterized protein n=1 Tax=Microcystis aeruginosa NIES-3807 TaxID=2517785 RepID=A0AAD3AY93_MICAE|nr:hypothetical protein NIES3806_08810 [Microcystis aeruginosa NIES-3806]GCL57838.1 hypothetical protein NIES3807_09980 [Microcystis aeruginosa NIES-3807]